MLHKTLHELVSVQYATINNLFSYSAKSYRGALLQVNKDINKYLKLGFVKKIPFNFKPKNTRQAFFYCATKKGAKAIDRLEDFTNRMPKSINNAEHESMKIDVALSFLRNFPDYIFDFNYNANLGGLKPDILAKAKNIIDGREYAFLVEVERKKEMTRIYREKVSKYNKFISKGIFKKNNLPPKTKVLFICSDLMFDIYARPLQYSEDNYRRSVVVLYKHFNALIESLKTTSDEHYRFLPITEFTKIAEPVWRTPNGTMTSIIN